VYRCSVALLLALAACPARAGDWPRFAGETLALGRDVWLDNCEGCHAYGIAGAPLAGDAQAWAQRVQQGRETLYEHAMEGFFGPRGTMMPPRGGNDELTDEQVRAAVDYMVRLLPQELETEETP